MSKFLSYPIYPFKVTQGFGENPQMYQYPKYGGIKGHNGIDCYGPDGWDVYASHDGKVTFADYDGSGGLGIVLQTENKYDYDDKKVFFKTIYWHLKEGSLKVKVGDKVKKGDNIAEADNTGASTGSHLHWGLKPVAEGENNLPYNVEQQNGYNGAIDLKPYFDGEYAFRPFGNFKFEKNIKFGDKSEDVKKLQEILKFYRTFPKEQECTGYYGDKTAFAVWKWQTDNKVDFQGTLDKIQGKSFGPKSRERMNKYFLP